MFVTLLVPFLTRLSPDTCRVLLVAQVGRVRGVKVEGLDGPGDPSEVLQAAGGGPGKKLKVSNVVFPNIFFKKEENLKFAPQGIWATRTSHSLSTLFTYSNDFNLNLN